MTPDVVQPAPPAPNDSRTTLLQWQKGIRIDHMAQSRAAAYYSRRSRGLGLIVTILSVFVGTSLFTGLASSKDLGTIVLVAGAVSAVTAVLTAVQTFLNYGELAEKARNAANSYGVLRRDIEETLATTTDSQKLAAAMSDMGKQWDQLDSEAPVIPQSIYNQAAADVDKRLQGEKSPIST